MTATESNSRRNRNRGPDVSTISLPDDRVLEYASYGREDGVPLLFHHGTPGSAQLGAILSYAARRRGVRVIAPSRPGYGGSDPHPDGTFDTWATDCRHLADELDMESFAVAGFSGGGPRALAVAEQLPERVTAAGVVSAPIPESDAGPLDSLARFPRLLGLAFRVGDFAVGYKGEDVYADRLTDRALDDATIHIVGEDLHAALANGPSGAVREGRVLAGDWSLPEPGPDVETTVWHGTDDDIVAFEPVRRAYEDRPDVSFEPADGDDHLGTLLAVRDALVELAE